MADLLNKVFMIFVRPYYVDTDGNKVFFKGSTYTGEIDGVNKVLTSTNTSSPANSQIKVNGNATYKNDPWFLFGTYSSYGKYQEDLKTVMSTYGTENIKTAVYVPMDYQVLPNQ
jgi:hypothetical protein